MKKIIIGSSAIKYHYPDFKRIPKDLDIAVDVKLSKSYDKENNTEYLYNPIIFKYINDDQEYVTASQILTLKMSHISWKVDFKKHMFDIQFLLKKGVRYDKKLYDELYNFWIISKGRKGKWRRSDLTLSAEDFFDNGIVSDHDHLHTLLKKVPTYTKILKEGCSVETCEKKFLNLTHEDKISLIQEEIMVMAYERFRSDQYRVGYDKMFVNFVTGHAPIWQLLFIIENFMELRIPQFNYYKKIENYDKINK